MLRKIVIGFAAAVLLSGCETPVTARYSILADNNAAIKALGVNGIGVGQFTGPSTFDANCRALGPLHVADNLSHTQYIQKAFEDELKVAGAFAGASPRVMLKGQVSRMEFSSSRGLTGGSWTIDLDLASSNGKEMKVAEYYEFPSGFIATEACRQTAEAFTRAVQNLVGKTVRSSEFVGLIEDKPMPDFQKPPAKAQAENADGETKCYLDPNGKRFCGPSK